MGEGEGRDELVVDYDMAKHGQGRGNTAAGDENVRPGGKKE